MRRLKHLRDALTTPPLMLLELGNQPIEYWPLLAVLGAGATLRSAWMVIAPPSVLDADEKARRVPS